MYFFFSRSLSLPRKNGLMYVKQQSKKKKKKCVNVSLSLWNKLGNKWTNNDFCGNWMVHRSRRVIMFDWFAERQFQRERWSMILARHIEHRTCVLCACVSVCMLAIRTTPYHRTHTYPRVSLCVILQTSNTVTHRMLASTLHLHGACAHILSYDEQSSRLIWSANGYSFYADKEFLFFSNNNLRIWFYSQLNFDTIRKFECEINRWISSAIQYSYWSSNCCIETKFSNSSLFRRIKYNFF